MKGTVGRFILFVKYPFWARSDQLPSTFDTITPVPKEVAEQVEELITGKVTYHELPPKQGRRKRIIRTVLGGGTEPPIGGGDSGVVRDVREESRKLIPESRGTGELPSRGISKSNSGTNLPISSAVRVKRKYVRKIITSESEGDTEKVINNKDKGKSPLVKGGK